MKPNDLHNPSQSTSNPPYHLFHVRLSNMKSDFQSNFSLLQQNGVQGTPVCGLVLVDLENVISHFSSSKSHHLKGSS